MHFVMPGFINEWPLPRMTSYHVNNTSSLFAFRNTIVLVIAHDPTETGVAFIEKSVHRLDKLYLVGCWLFASTSEPPKVRLSHLSRVSFPISRRRHTLSNSVGTPSRPRARCTTVQIHHVTTAPNRGEPLRGNLLPHEHIVPLHQPLFELRLPRTQHSWWPCVRVRPDLPW